LAATLPVQARAYGTATGRATHAPESCPHTATNTFHGIQHHWAPLGALVREHGKRGIQMERTYP
jgi:hypothetical protein